jgi:DNA helicase II / ATP-dependent DNA helicase PcrA
MVKRTIESLRTPDAVIAAIALPKTGVMRSVLSTIQPDQYDLIKALDDRSLVVQGLPGTGKTVVAIHRAAYLVDPDWVGGQLGRVLIVGPTDQYIEHVSRVLNGVAKGEISLLSIAGLVDESAKMKHIPRSDVEQREEIANSSGLWNLVQAAAIRLNSQGLIEGPRSKRINTILTSLKKRNKVIADISEDERLWEWLSSIGPNKDVKDSVEMRPLLAAINVAIGEDRPHLFDHIIIDEAQDLSPIEWHLVTKRIKKNGAMTLFGDLNQRHNMFGIRSWEEVFATANLPEPEIRTIETGFRTTRQILEFANQYLDAEIELPLTLRDGAEPEEIRVAKDDVVETTCAFVLEVAAEVSPGTLAIISEEKEVFDNWLQESGWKSTGAFSGWQKDGLTVISLSPTSARGLEFDGVIVVEPADLIRAHSRGVLYTSFTMPTKILKIVSTRDWA